MTPKRGMTLVGLVVAGLLLVHCDTGDGQPSGSSDAGTDVAHVVDGQPGDSVVASDVLDGRDGQEDSEDTPSAPDVPATDAPDVPATDAPDVPATDATDVPTSDAVDVLVHDATDVPAHDTTDVAANDTNDAEVSGCKENSDCSGDPGACSILVCDQVANACKSVPAENDTACTDPCGDAGQCAAGVCVAKSSPSCDDGNPCTLDECAPVIGCTHAPKVGPCDDGSVCTTSDTCSDGKCGGTPNPDCCEPVCSGKECGSDGCSGLCGTCDDGEQCNAGGHCEAIPCDGFQCQSGVCLDAAFRCDGSYDCASGDDEANTCSGADTIDVCYGEDIVGFDCSADCGDYGWISNGCEYGSAWEGSYCFCGAPCSEPGAFACSPGKCVPGDAVCDGWPSCPGGEDEQGCPCSGFSCNDGTCIPSYYQCDGYTDCASGEDEVCECVTSGTPNTCSGPDTIQGCEAGSFAEYGCGTICADYGWVSNGCEYGSAWEGTYCFCGVSCGEPGAFACSPGKCVAEEDVCDGGPHCPGGEDEQGCPCDGFSCNDGTCIPSYYQCDYDLDCSTGEDELGCPCNGYQCPDGQCLPSSYQCDGISDCTGGEDEVCECVAFSTPNTCSGPDTLQICEAGSFAEYDCSAICADYGWISNGCEFGAVWQKNLCYCGSPCSEPGAFACSPGKCIPGEAACDGWDGCPGGEDEQGCPCDGFSCNDGTCIPSYYQCDYYVDCSTGEDEQGCPCDGFTCNDGSCIPSFYQCDGWWDCWLGDDEQDCP